MAAEGRQYVRYLFLKLDPAWRRLAAAEQAAHRQEFVEAARGFHRRLLLRAYSLVGTRGDADLMLWQAADDLASLQQLQTALLSTRLGAFLFTPYSYLGVTRRSIYELPPNGVGEPVSAAGPQEARFLFVYPFVKTREWYALPLDRRRELMEEHIRVGREYPGVRLNTIYSFGLDDQDFVVGFEAGDPAEFVELVMRLRETAASAYTLRDTPVFTCLHMSLPEALDAFGCATAPNERVPTTNGPVEVASLGELTENAGRRVHLGGEPVALFRAAGRIFAVGDRCPHGRASLSEGSVDPGTCRLRCPWHGGTFDLATGLPLGGPARSPIATYPVRLDGDRILLG